MTTTGLTSTIDLNVNKEDLTPVTQLSEEQKSQLMRQFELNKKKQRKILAAQRYRRLIAKRSINKGRKRGKKTTL